MKNTNQIRAGALLSYFAIAFNILAGLIYTPWMIGEIGQSHYGLYTLATSFITLFTIDFGMSAAATRFISKYRAEGDEERVFRIVGLIYKLYLLIDLLLLVVLFVLFFFLDVIYANLSPEELAVFKGLYLIVGAYTVLSFPFTTTNGMLMAYEQFKPLKLCDIFHKLLIILLMVAALLAGQGVYALVLVNSVTGILTIAAKLLLIRKKTPIRPRFRGTARGELSQFFGFSAWTTVASVAKRLIFNITPTIIAAVSISGAAGVAVFGLASTIEGYVFTFANAIDGMFMPRVSGLVRGENSRERLLSLMIKIGRLQCMIIGILVVGFVALGQAFITDIWNKPDFGESYLCAILLILPSFLYLPMQIANTTVTVENKVRLRAYVYIAMGLINVALSLVLSHFFGALGASLSIFIAYLFRSVAMAVIYKRALGFDMGRFFRGTYLRLVPQLLLTLGIGLLFSHLNPIGNPYLKFLADGAVLVLSYFLIMWVCGFNSYEKGLLRSLTLRLRHKKT